MKRLRWLIAAIMVLPTVLVTAALLAAHSGVPVKADTLVTVSGTVTDANSQPVTGVTVTATIKKITYGPVTTDANGAYALSLPAGSYTFHFVPASGARLLPKDVPVVAMSNQTVNVQLQPLQQTFSGTILDAAHNPITGLSVEVTPAAGGAMQSTTTDTQGHFLFNTLPSGTYGVIFRHPENGTDGQWEISPTEDVTQPWNVLQPIDLTTGDYDHTYVLPQSHTLTLSYSGDSAYSYRTNSGNTIGYQLQSEGDTYSAGSYFGYFGSPPAAVATVFQGMDYAAGSICIDFSYEGTNAQAHVCNTAPVTMDGDKSLTVAAPALHHLMLTTTLGGVPATMTFEMNSLDGTISASAGCAGTCDLLLPASVYGFDIGFQGTNLHTGPIDMTQGDVTQAMQLPAFRTIQVQTEDAAGAPLTNETVNAMAVFATPYEADGLSYTGSTGSRDVVDQNGMMNINALDGMTFYGTDQTAQNPSICMWPNSSDPTGSQTVCYPTTFVVTSSTTDIVLQEPYVTPAAPTNLSAPSPTNSAPALQWDAVANADHYDVYRDGVKVGSSQTTTFADTTAPDGTLSYYVEAVGSTGAASDPSNTVTVSLDRTAPVVNITAPTAGSTLSGTVTITGTVTEVHPLRYYIGIFDSQGHTVKAYAVNNPTGNTISYNWDTTTAANGQYSITLSAIDTYGNKDAHSTQSIRVTVHN